MITDDIIRIKDSILDTVGENCEKIILFGSYADNDLIIARHSFHDLHHKLEETEGQK
ncbi:hypothetical protein FACS1894151_02160 [Spirochaetia bacterium]|nr:hypothetical protein FACS1894151_02160 [Spirochaetia bacterium]